jgi:hypothetical protein
MPKVWIEKNGDEWYPVFSFYTEEELSSVYTGENKEHWYHPVELSQETVDKFNAARKNFDDYQDALIDLLPE